MRVAFRLRSPGGETGRLQEGGHVQPIQSSDFCLNEREAMSSGGVVDRRGRL